MGGGCKREAFLVLMQEEKAKTDFFLLLVLPTFQHWIRTELKVLQILQALLHMFCCTNRNLGLQMNK